MHAFLKPAALVSLILAGISSVSSVAIPVTQRITFVNDASGAPAICAIPPADNVIPYNYTGRWYEIGTSAITRETIEVGCACIEARYSLRPNGDIAVQNVCTNTTVPHHHDNTTNIVVANGNATVVVNPSTGKFEGFAVSFPGFPSKEVNYVPVKIFGNYDHVLVGSPCYLYMWILSRHRKISKHTYNKIVDYAESVGFNTTAIGFSKSDQKCSKKDRRAYPPIPPRQL